MHLATSVSMKHSWRNISSLQNKNLRWLTSLRLYAYLSLSIPKTSHNTAGRFSASLIRNATTESTCAGCTNRTSLNTSSILDERVMLVIIRSTWLLSLAFMLSDEERMHQMDVKQIMDKRTFIRLWSLLRWCGDVIEALMHYGRRLGGDAGMTRGKLFATLRHFIISGAWCCC
jgi:hypothetical protein